MNPSLAPQLDGEASLARGNARANKPARSTRAAPRQRAGWSALRLVVALSCVTTAACTPERFQRLLTHTHAALGYAVRPTPAGGYVVAGSAAFPGQVSPMTLVDTGADGEPIWAAPIGSSVMGWATHVVPVVGGELVACGTELPNPPGPPQLLALSQVDAAGAVEWHRVLAALPPGSNESAECQGLEPALDGGYRLIWKLNQAPPGQTARVWVLATDAAGVEIWRHPIEGGVSGPAALTVTPDGHTIVAATTSLLEVRLLDLDATGNEQWTRTYASSVFRGAVITSIDGTQDGAFFLVGSIVSPLTHVTAAALIKIDRAGSILWTRYPSDFDGDTVISDGVHGLYGGYAAVGWQLAPESGCLLVKTSDAGEVEWSRLFGPPGVARGCTSVRSTRDGGFVFTGLYSPGDMYLVKTDSTGDAGPPPA